MPKRDYLRKRHTGFAGHATGAAAWLEPYADAGVAPRCPHLAGDPESQMGAVARIRQELGW